jgi:hypothetical protein
MLMVAELGSSHRPGQLTEYLVRARHHNPGPGIDLLYLTQPMTAAAAPDGMPERCRFAHLTWLEDLEVADEVRGDSEDPRDVRCLALLRDRLSQEGALAAGQALKSRTAAGEAVVSNDLPVEWEQVPDGAVQAAAQAGQPSARNCDNDIGDSPVTARTSSEAGPISPLATAAYVETHASTCQSGAP